MKPKMRILSFLLATVISISSMVLPACAQGDDPEQDKYDVIVQTPQETKPKQPTSTTEPIKPKPSTSTTPSTDPAKETTTPAPTIAPDGKPFTEDSIVATRDLLYDAATNKQYITVETRNGNTFYIVIDYDQPLDEDGEQYYTYFLNQVDEADLLALLEDESAPPVCVCAGKCVVGSINTQCEICSANMTECMGVPPTEPPQTTEPPEPPEEPEPSGSGGKILLVLALFAASAGGAGYYFLKVKAKNQPQTKGNDDLDDYDFGEEDEGYAEFEKSEPETEQEE